MLSYEQLFFFLLQISTNYFLGFCQIPYE